jgi:hypothetical protein
VVSTVSYQSVKRIKKRSYSSNRKPQTFKLSHGGSVSTMTGLRFDSQYGRSFVFAPASNPALPPPLPPICYSVGTGIPSSARRLPWSYDIRLQLPNAEDNARSSIPVLSHTSARHGAWPRTRQLLPSVQLCKNHTRHFQHFTSKTANLCNLKCFEWTPSLTLYKHCQTLTS